MLHFFRSLYYNYARRSRELAGDPVWMFRFERSIGSVEQ
jgi:hypothetical protein